MCFNKQIGLVTYCEAEKKARHLKKATGIKRDANAQSLTTSPLRKLKMMMWFSGLTVWGREKKYEPKFHVRSFNLQLLTEF